MKYTYARSQRLCVGAMSNVVEATIEAASPSGERQSMRKLCKKIFGHTIGNKVLLSMKHLQLKDKPGKLCPISVRPFRVS